MGEVVFLTGSTGLVGGSVLLHLLELDVDQIFCLVRNGPTKTSEARVADRLLLTETHGFGDRVKVLSGDITSPNLGLSDGVLVELLSRVTVVVHCAANTSFLASQDNWKVNVSGTANLLAAAAYESP